MASDKLAELAKYTACDISDALLKLDIPGGGFLPDITPLNTDAKVIAPATTVLFIPKPTPSFPEAPPNNNNPHNASANMPAGSSYSDLVTPDTIVLLSQPKGAQCATMGGIMAARMNKVGAKGVLVDGRVRDVNYLKTEMGMPVWAKATSIVATGGEAKAHAVNVPVSVGATQVEPGDIIMLDPSENGAVCIPADKVDAVLDLIPKLVEADDKAIADVLAGVTVQEAFRRHRGK